MSQPSASPQRSDEPVELFANSARDTGQEFSEHLTDAASAAAGRARIAAATAEDTAVQAYVSVEKFVKENPVIALIGAATASAALVMVLKNRDARERTLQKKLIREVSRYSRSVQDAVRSEMKSIDTSAALSSLTRLIPEHDIHRLVSPWIDKLNKRFQ